MKDLYARAEPAFAALLALSILGGSTYAADAPDFSGIYWATRYNAKIELVGGASCRSTRRARPPMRRTSRA